MARIRHAHPCGHLDIGLSIAPHRERSTIDEILQACKAYQIELPDNLADCTPSCPEWSEDESMKGEPGEPEEEPEAPAAEETKG